MLRMRTLAASGKIEVRRVAQACPALRGLAQNCPRRPLRDCARRWIQECLLAQSPRRSALTQSPEQLYHKERTDDYHYRY
jgi:hypothetical protein